MLAERLKEWQKKYEREGLEKGMQQGVVKGRRELLLRLLERRFGPLAPTATSLDEVFGGA